MLHGKEVTPPIPGWPVSVIVHDQPTTCFHQYESSKYTQDKGAKTEDRKGAMRCISFQMGSM